MDANTLQRHARLAQMQGLRAIVPGQCLGDTVNIWVATVLLVLALTVDWGQTFVDFVTKLLG
ncbi:MAG: hypothetical protein Q7S95_03955 [bacterium]|nr:hypothetical protein [bacterium]